MRIKILKIVSCITAVLGILSACCLDSESWIPSIVCGVCLGWWTLFGYANNWFEEKPNRRRKSDKATQRKIGVVIDFDREAM